MNENIVKIICGKDNDETDVRVLEEKENSVTIMMGLYYAHTIEDYETVYDKKAIIYFGDKLVKEYIRIPYQNKYDDDEEFGSICLFPKAKYEFILH